MRLLSSLAVVLTLIGPARAEGPKEGPSEQVLDRVAPAVVRVMASQCTDRQDRAASGFVWSDKGIVTDLHVIAGCGKLVVNYQGIDNFPATVLHANPRADLVLLQVPGAPKVQGLEVAGRKAEIGEKLNVFGYPLGVPRRDTMPLSVSYATKESPKLGDGLSPDASRQLLAQGIPDLSTEVLHVDGGNLLPGHSGAPLIDWQGRVLGIGSGGLASGTAGIGWAVKADYLADLPTAGASVPALAARATESFAYVLPNRGAEDTVKCGDLTLYRTRQGRLGRIAQTSDDPDRIDDLASEIGGVDFASLRAARMVIWTERTSGAAVAIPAGAQLVVGPDDCTVRTGNAGVSMIIRADRAPQEVATVAWDFAKFAAYRRSFHAIVAAAGTGLRYRGHGLLSGPHMVNGAEVERRLGEAETAGGRRVRMYRADMNGRGAMLLVAAVARDLKPDSPDATRNAWAQALMGVHLSSFPGRSEDARQQGIAPLPRTYKVIDCGDEGLSQLESQPAQWTAPRWGFVVQLPPGAEPTPRPRDCIATTGDRSLRYMIRLAATPNGQLDAARQAAVAAEFRRDLAQLAGVGAWRIVPDGASATTALEGTDPSGRRVLAWMSDPRPARPSICCMQVLVAAIDTDPGSKGDQRRQADARAAVMAARFVD